MPYELIRDDTRKVFIPRSALWGAETALARELYHATGYKTPPQFIAAIALVKKAAARAHKQLGVLEPPIAEAIERAADEIIAGMHDDQFPLDVLNSGAGTSLHMNVNEVVARRATEFWTSKARGLRIDAHDHVNMGQSTNDVLPTALRIAAAKELRDLVGELVLLRDELKNIALNLWDVKTSGRTHMRDALPASWGERFHADAEHIDAACSMLNTARLALHTLWLGGTAIGTGANTVHGYRTRAVREIAQMSGIPFQKSPHTYASGTFQEDFLEVAAGLRILAIQLKNLGRKLELASSGPRAALGELILPDTHPGSSIMAGKRNPSVLENMKMACLLTEGNVCTIEQAAKETDFDLNACVPLIAWKLLETITMHTTVVRMLRAHCLQGLRADKERCRKMYEETAMWPTLLAPLMGYERAAELTSRATQEAPKKNKTILQALVSIARKEHILFPDGVPVTERELERLAFPKRD